MFYFHPYLGKISILTIIFFRWVETTNQSRSSRVVRDDMFGAMPFNASLKWENTPPKFNTDLKFLEKEFPFSDHHHF